MNKLMTFTSKILKKEQLTTDVIKLSLERPEEFEFEAGQFISIKCKKDTDEKWRSYSILNEPSHKDSIDLCIKTDPNGFGSAFFLDVAQGDELEVKGPMGHFKLQVEAKEKEHIFLAAGTGVVPFYSMIKEFVTKNANLKFTLYLGVRRKENLLFYDELKEIEQKYENFTFHQVLSREEDWEGLKGHVQDHLPKETDNKIFYICGLKELVLETEELLLNKGVDKDKIKKERYS